MNRRQFNQRLLCATTALLGAPVSGCVTQMNKESDIAGARHERVILTHGSATLETDPGLGGSLSGFRIGQTKILRPTPMNTGEITDTASFPLIPIVNRIPGGEFVFEGRRVDLEGNFMGLPDFIHGHGWRSSWSLVDRTEARATIEFEHLPGRWPWHYRGRQVVELRPDGYRHTLLVENLSAENMPAALGFHPYFPTTENTKLTFEFEGHWINNEWGHAIRQQLGPSRKDFRSGADLIDTVMTDATHYGWDGRARLTEPGRPDIEITASPKCRNLHVFFPPNGDFVAIEPTSGRSNPFNVGPVEYETLIPGASFEVWMDVAVIAQSESVPLKRSG